MQLIIFKLKNQFYGFTTESIEEITRPLEETVIPQGPSWTQGLVNLRGQIMTLIDMEVLLNGSSSTDKLWYNNTVIVNAANNPIALMVGKVLGVVDILEEDLHKDTDEENDTVLGYISAYNEMITIIQLDSILKEKEEVA